MIAAAAVALSVLETIVPWPSTPDVNTSLFSQVVDGKPHEVIFVRQQSHSILEVSSRTLEQEHDTLRRVLHVSGGLDG